MNHNIPVDKMRLIFLDPKTSKKQHKIVTKKEALAMAKKMNLDVVAMNLEADPPVCKLESYGRILMEEREKERAQRASQRAQVIKEVQVVLGIDRHDFETKINKIKDFLSSGHPVRLTFLPRRRRILTKKMWIQKEKTGFFPEVRESPTALISLDESTLFLFAAFEGESVVIQQKDTHNSVPVDPPCVDADGNPVMINIFAKREFLLVQKTKTKPPKYAGKKEAATVESQAPVA